MRRDELVEHLHKGGIFGGIVLVPVAIAVQTYSIESLGICLVGFIIYVFGLGVFAGKAIEASRPDFARSGRFICGTAYLIATIAATSVALAPGMKGEVVNRFSKDVAKQIELISNNPGKSVSIPPPASTEALQKASLVAGSVDSKSIVLTPLSVVSEPFLGGVVEGLNRSLVLVFEFGVAVSALAIVFGLFVAPHLPPPANSGRGSR